jgi:oxazoline/thiazoline dehydrogenase
MTDVSAARFILRLHPDVREVGMVGPAMRIMMRSWSTPEDVPFAFPAAGPVLALLAAPGLSLADLRARASGIDGGWEAVEAAIASLARKRLLAWAYGEPADPWLRIEALGGRFAPDYAAPQPQGRRLSRFAFLRRDGERILLESPEVDARIVLTPKGLGLLPAILAAGDESAPGRDPAVEHVLARCGFMEPPGPEAEDRRTWAFHDRLFHEATRNNVSGRLLGGTYPFKDVFPSPPAVKPPMSAALIELPASAGTNASASLYEVMERRRSRRGPGRRPLQLDELAHLLWRVARVRAVRSATPQDVVDRPIPGGGSIGELEFYLAIHRCDGLESGFYHYVGTQHALAAIPTAPALLKRAIDQAGTAQGLEGGARPDCLMIVSSRLPRLAWKYENVAYRVALLNAGVAVEALYLVATDLGLSPCAMGTASSTLFEQITGLAPWEETAIAEFTVSGPP